MSHSHKVTVGRLMLCEHRLFRIDGRKIATFRWFQHEGLRSHKTIVGRSKHDECV